MSINLKTAVYIVVILAFVALSIVTCSLSKRLDTAQKEIEQSRATIESQSHEMQKYQNMCKLIQENERIKSETVASFIESSNQSQAEHVQRIQSIETSADSCDWLDMPVPDSVRLLFGAYCADGNHHGNAAIGTDDAMRPATSPLHNDKP